MSIHSLLTLFFLATALTACGTDSAEAEPADGRAPASVDSTAVGHNQPVDWRAALLKLPIAFPEYTAYYREVFPDFAADRFERVDSTRVDEFLTAGTENVDSLEARYGSWLVPSPSGDYWLDVVSYGLVAEATGSKTYNYVTGGPDSQVAIVNRKTGKRTRLLFCGTPCSYAMGVWLDDRAVQIAGRADRGDGFRPTVWQVDIDSGKILEWHYPRSLPPGAAGFNPLLKD